MKFIKELLKQDSDVSAMRLMALASLAIAGFIGCYGIIKSADLGGVAQLCGVFIGGAFMGKAAQKFAEVKNGKEIDN